MTTDVDRIAALEQKVTELQDRLDWALLATRWLMTTTDSMIRSDAMIELFQRYKHAADGYSTAFGMLDLHLKKAVEQSMGDGVPSANVTEEVR